jgi:hypothetical protein
MCLVASSTVVEGISVESLCIVDDSDFQLWCADQNEDNVHIYGSCASCTQQIGLIVSNFAMLIKLDSDQLYCVYSSWHLPALRPRFVAFGIVLAYKYMRRMQVFHKPTYTIE